MIKMIRNSSLNNKQLEILNNQFTKTALIGIPSHHIVSLSQENRAQARTKNQDIYIYVKVYDK